jgi:hypothetical protein
MGRTKMKPCDLYLEIQASEYAGQLNGVLKKGDGDIDPEFMGFTDTYRHLAEIIPVGRTVIDLGCAYAFQAWYFRNHKAYIGVDLVADEAVFRTHNSKFYSMTIEDFIAKHANEYQHCFAICNYVPTKTDSLRRTFPELFVFYPQRGDRPEMKAAENLMFGHR